MEYVYAAMLLHKAGKKVDEAHLTKVLTAAGVKADDARVKALVAALDNVNIDDAVKQAAPVATAVASAPVASESKPEECHRTKLIGEELIELGINLNHITRTKNRQKQLIIKDQKKVMLIVAPNGTVNLFGEELSFGSRKKYKEDAL